VSLNKTQRIKAKLEEEQYTQKVVYEAYTLIDKKSKLLMMIRTVEEMRIVGYISPEAFYHYGKKIDEHTRLILETLK
jgi:hypothetical protein